jgi:hypothetical protein
MSRKKATVRTVALIPNQSAARDSRDPEPWVERGIAIQITSTPPTKKEPLRRKLSLRLVSYQRLTDLGVKIHNEQSYEESPEWWLREIYNAPNHCSFNNFALKNIPLNDGSIDEIIDGLITAKEFLAGASDSIT